VDFGNFARRLGQMAAENSPVLLTAVGVTGTLATAYLTGKGAFKAKFILDDVAAEKSFEYSKNLAEAGVPDVSLRDYTPEQKAAYDEAHSLTFQEMWNATWKCYIPAAGVAALTVASIICANRIGTRRAAAMASAYAVAEKGFEEYRKKVADKIGKPKEREVRDEVAAERVRKNHRTASNGSRKKVPVGDDKNCYDTFSDRRFFGTANQIEAAVNTFNQQILHDGFATLSEFYHLLDMQDTGYSDMMGWNSDALLEINITSVIVDDDPCLALVFVNQPKMEYRNFH
jgi:hypothetical protein